MPSTGQHPFTRAATGHRRAPVSAAPHDDLLPTGARAVRSEGFAGRAWARVALQDAYVRAPCGLSILPLGTRGFHPLERLGAGLATGVGREVVVVWGFSPAAAEAGVGEVACGGGVHELAPRAAPGGGGGVCSRGCVGRRSWRAHPLADAREVEDGEAAVAGPDGRRPPHHVVADHALHRAAGELVLDLLHELRHGPIAPNCRCHRRRRRRSRTGRVRRRGRWPLRQRAAATVARRVVALLLGKRGAAIIAVVGAALAALVGAGLRGRSREGQDWGAGIWARSRAVGGARGARAPHRAGGGSHGSTPAAAIGGGLHAAAGREG